MASAPALENWSAMFGRARVRAAAIVVAVVAITALGVGLRVFLLQRSLWMVEGDEAIVGLAAKHILEGERPVFL